MSDAARRAAGEIVDAYDLAEITELIAADIQRAIDSETQALRERVRELESVRDGLVSLELARLQAEAAACRRELRERAEYTESLHSAVADAEARYHQENQARQDEQRRSSQRLFALDKEKAKVRELEERCKEEVACSKCAAVEAEIRRLREEHLRERVQELEARAINDQDRLAKLEKVLEAAKDYIPIRVESDEAIKTLCFIGHLHGEPYSGPNCGPAFEALRAAVKEAECEQQ